MQIYSFKCIDSTQEWLIRKIEEKVIEVPCAVVADMQTDGIGSRKSEWIGIRGNFFASFALFEQELPKDLPLSAISIYFSYIMRDVLVELGSSCWLKWPNDLYLNELKIGGCITAKKGKVLIVGIGVNLVDAPQNFGVLDIDIEPIELLRLFIKKIESKVSWKQIFSNFRLEFHKSRRYAAHIGDDFVELKDAELLEDGSLKIGERRVVSLR